MVTASWAAPTKALQFRSSGGRLREKPAPAGYLLVCLFSYFHRQLHSFYCFLWAMCCDASFHLQEGLSSPSQGVLALGGETEPGPGWGCLVATVLLQGWHKPSVLQPLLLSPELGAVAAPR